MQPKQHNDFGRRATALLASTIVYALGLFVCAFVAFAFSDDVKKPLLVCVGVLLPAGLLMWLLREKPHNQTTEKHFFWITRKKPLHYMPRYRQAPEGDSAACKYGTNEPPTAEEIRKLKDNTRTWVPSRESPKR